MQRVVLLGTKTASVETDLFHGLFVKLENSLMATHRNQNPNEWLLGSLGTSLILMHHETATPITMTFLGQELLLGRYGEETHPAIQ
tara:strand:- start:2320 stop:2577 length:258 start_codon:yes stop_codon:yes gene_type:complete